MACSMIRLEGVTKRFGATTAVDAASLCVDRGEVVALLGPSGCGKTTLLRLIAGFERPDGGSVAVDGRVVAAPGTWVSPEARRVGMVFQDYALFPHLTVAENVGFGLPRRERARRVRELLGMVGLDGLERRYPHELSGGQQQRVALARALAPSPELVLLDEPWSNVDPFLRESLRAEITEIIRPLGVTVVLVTHDREEAFSLAARLALGSRVRGRGERARRARRRRTRRDEHRRLPGERRLCRGGRARARAAGAARARAGSRGPRRGRRPRFPRA